MFKGYRLFAALGIFVCVSFQVFAQDEPKRVMGGKPTNIKSYPWQVVLKINHDNESWICGGSIVESFWVLTAAHCFYGDATAGYPPIKKEHVRVKSGVTKLSEGSWAPIERVEVHPDYKPNPTVGRWQHDIALLKLQMQAAGKEIPLAEPALDVPAQQQLEVTGWGETAFGKGDVQAVLRMAKVPHQDVATCNAPDANDGRVKKGMLCAGRPEGKVDACRGDSGGPLVWRRQQGPVLVGVVSWGQGCGRELKFGVYTNVSSYREWIASVLAGDRK